MNICEDLSRKLKKYKPRSTDLWTSLNICEQSKRYIGLDPQICEHLWTFINKAKEIIQKKLSVRQVEKIASEFKKNKGTKISKDPNIVDLEKELSDKIGLKTSIQFNENGSSGSLTLYYSDLNQLDDLMKRLKK